LSKLTMGLEPMLHTFIKCPKGVEHNASICPKHYPRLSKGMETASAAIIVNCLF
jgi:hypothetical protein